MNKEQGESKEKKKSLLHNPEETGQEKALKFETLIN